METMELRRTVLGIDPGRNTGLYSVSIPAVSHALTLDELQRHAYWLGNAAIAVSTRESISRLQAWREMYDRLGSVIVGAKPEPDLVVLEYPADGMTKWSGGSARGTEFHLGMFFGFAAIVTGIIQAHKPTPTAVALMPVTSSKARNRVGWMPKVTTVKGNRRVTHTQDRETTLRQCREIAHCLGENSNNETQSPGRQSSEEVDALSDHELMALGVLTYYVTNRAPAEWGK